MRRLIKLTKRTEKTFTLGPNYFRHVDNVQNYIIYSEKDIGGVKEQAEYSLPVCLLAIASHSCMCDSRVLLLCVEFDCCYPSDNAQR